MLCAGTCCIVGRGVAFWVPGTYLVLGEVVLGGAGPATDSPACTQDLAAQNPAFPTTTMLLLLLLLLPAACLQEDINEEPRPRMWWPKDIWGKYAGALEEFKQPEAAGKAVQCLNHMVR